MKLKLKVRDRNIDKLIDGDAIQSIDLGRGKPAIFYTDDEGYTKFTDNFEIIIEFLPPEPVNLEL